MQESKRKLAKETFKKEQKEMNHTIVREMKIIPIHGGTVAGTTNIDMTEVDALGYDSVLFIVNIGAILTGGIAKLNCKGKVLTGDSYGAGTIGDILTGAANIPTLGDADDDKLLVLNIGRITRQFMRCRVERTVGNVTILSAIAILYNAGDNASLPTSARQGTAPNAPGADGAFASVGTPAYSAT